MYGAACQLPTNMQRLFAQPNFGHLVTGSRPSPAATQGLSALPDAQAACGSIWVQPQVYPLVSQLAALGWAP